MSDPKIINIVSQSWFRDDGYEICTDRDRIDLDVALACLREDAYWFASLDRDRLGRAFDGSLSIGVFDADGQMAGFARLVTDFAVFAYLRDVFILPPHRGKGLGSWIAEQIREHPQLQEVSTWMLRTKDAHGVYEKAGYEIASDPEWFMMFRKS